MKRRLLRRYFGAILVLALLNTLLSLSAVWAATVSGKVGPGQTRAYAVDTKSSGQLLVTLFWKSKSSDLVLQVICNNEVAGTATGRSDRFQRLEVGVSSGRICEVGVSAIKGASKFWLNLQYTGSSNSLQGKTLRVLSTGSGEFGMLRNLSDPERLESLRNDRP